MTDARLTPEQILELPMQQPNDAAAATIRGYLIRLLDLVWAEDEGFDGKRPFGNSGWSGELELALVLGGAVTGKVDGDGWLDEVDSDAADVLIRDAIRSLAPAEQFEQFEVA